MKLLVSDMARIAQRFTADGFTEVDVTEFGMRAEKTVGNDSTVVRVEFITKPGGAPGIRVNRNILTKTTPIDESV